MHLLSTKIQVSISEPNFQSPIEIAWGTPGCHVALALVPSHLPSLPPQMQELWIDCSCQYYQWSLSKIHYTHTWRLFRLHLQDSVCILDFEDSSIFYHAIRAFLWSTWQSRSRHTQMYTEWNNRKARRGIMWAKGIKSAIRHLWFSAVRRISC